jgi:endonuclease/exonuclease/phosphatase family metal-dependent hydrolase
VLIRAITWNLFHGRDAPPDRALYTWRSRLLKVTERGERYVQVNRDLFGEFSAVLDELEWDVALLQESPPRWAAALARDCGAQGHRVLTARNRLLPLSGLIARFNPDLIASSEGGSNLTLVRGALLDGGAGILERRELVIREGHPERRVMAFVRTARGLCVANLHASTNRPDLASEEVLDAAATAVAWAGPSPLIFGGDLNLRPGRQPEPFDELRRRFQLERPTGAHSIDHLLARGLRIAEAPHSLPCPELVRGADAVGPLGLHRREVGRRIRLSDHAPVGASFEASTDGTPGAQAH